MDRIMNIGIIANLYGNKTKLLLEGIEKWANDYAVNIYFLTEKPAEFDEERFKSHIIGKYVDLGRESFPEDIEFILSIGGDGTLLKAAHIVAPYNVPVLGINQGRIGFLTVEYEPPLVSLLNRILRKNYTISERRMLHISTEDRKLYALNDAIITRFKGLAVIQLCLSINDTKVADFYGDGVIVATPTGSTGYSLSAGGPVITPETEVNVITPICPHTLGIRPLVVNAEDVIRIISFCSRTSIVLNADGLESIFLKPEEIVEITSHPEYKIKLVHMSDEPFFSLLKQKLEWVGEKKTTGSGK